MYFPNVQKSPYLRHFSIYQIVYPEYTILTAISGLIVSHSHTILRLYLRLLRRDQMLLSQLVELLHAHGWASCGGYLDSLRLLAVAEARLEKEHAARVAGHGGIDKTRFTFLIPIFRRADVFTARFPVFCSTYSVSPILYSIPTNTRHNTKI